MSERQELEAALRDAFYLAENAGRMLMLGYDAGYSHEIRRLHAIMPKHLHKEDCDGCFAYESQRSDTAGGQR